SRSWYGVWMGLLSYLIAQAKSANVTGTDEHWQQALIKNGFPSDTIDALLASTVCDFSSTIERAGVFLDLTSKNTKQPSIEWFLKYNIPVWYRWGAQEMSIPSLAFLAPLESQIQCAVLDLNNPVQETRVLAKRPEPVKETSSQSAKRPEYEVFFTARDQRNARRLLHESPTDRQTRLNRERKPPTVSAPVFEWVRSEDDENVWCRVQVRRADREETLGQYSEQQRRYDSFSNEWDCCEEFGPGDEEDDWDYDRLLSFPDESIPTTPPYDTSTVPVIFTPSSVPEQLLDSERLDVPHVHSLRRAAVYSSKPTSTEPMSQLSPVHSSSTSPEPPIPMSKLFRSRKIDALNQEILDLLHLHYGFTIPLPLPRSTPLLTSEAESKRLVRFLGLSWDQCRPYIGQVPCTSLAKSYLDGLAAGHRPKDDDCDLNMQNRLSLSMSERCHYLRIVESVGQDARSFYLFDFGDRAEVPWKLALTNAADALLVCRLDPRFRESDIVEYLLQHAIPFRTFLHMDLASAAPRQTPPPTKLPIRASNFQFGVKDYDAYVRQREMILTQPRGRVALMRGGIIWRLSTSVVNFSSVLQGPTGWSPIPNTMVTVRDPKTNELFIDDNLTDVELSLISGTYVCHTGKPSPFLSNLQVSLSFRCS
ncbi:hypothetical protein C0989_006570, partial [Termitomyces sp. Mn162]